MGGNMKEIIKIFNKQKIRVIIKCNEPYFNAQDVCFNLDLSNTSQALTSIEKDDIICNDVIDTIGRKRSVYFVSEQGLYDLIFKSKKSIAKDFQRWVTHEVLPSIRKTGQYSIPTELKKLSTEKRNMLTDQWKSHGCNKPHHYIQLTGQEYKSLNIDKKKAEMDKKELLLLSALETMEALKLLDRDDISGYYECLDSIKETGEQLKVICDNNKKPQIEITK